jgi:phosphohistidine swiveling domain-containing protein
MAAGDYFVWIAILGGSGYKSEVQLAEFYRRHVAPRIGGDQQRLLVGLAASPAVPPHAAISLDWLHPTLGELERTTSDDHAAGTARATRAIAQRHTAEAEVREVLASKRSLLRRFEALLADAQGASRLRDAVIEPFTLAWPVMRRALLRIGETLAARGVVAQPADVFFLVRDELDAEVRELLSVDRRAVVAERREMWQRQGRFTPPTTLGQTFLMRALGARAEGLRAHSSGQSSPDDRLLVQGLPASPGRVTGRARVIHGHSEFGELRPGEVLVAPATTPAWSVLFPLAAAVVTDSGSPLAHIALLAREYGIPAVVATGSATTRLHTGQMVTVDGGMGRVVEP